jgi:hypothetical protein
MAVVGGDGNGVAFVFGATGGMRLGGYNSAYSGSSIEAVNAAQSAYQPMAINGSYTVLATGGTERMRIDTSGNLLVGKTAQTLVGRLEVTSSTPYNFNTYNSLALSSSTGATVVNQLQQTTSVSTSATTILSPGQYASFCLVFGSDGTNRFMDIVLFSIGTGNLNVISSLNCSGSPGARTYSQSSSTLRLAMASGTYTVQVSALSMNG